MADWDEIKRLAADFQRTQTSDTLQRISERNCIDIVKKLTDLGLIELIYTCDGHEFLTPEHLLKEIEDEVYVNGGRVHLHDLASNLNVDYQHVENKAKELARDRPDEYNLILGQVIHSTYKKTLSKLIYDTMNVSGQLSIADFAKSLDLPSEFLMAMVKEILPTLVEEYVTSPDGRTYYTTDMMDRYKSIISGTLFAITKPTTLASIKKKIDIPDRMFNPIIEGLVKEGRIDATLENRMFIPSIYAREQNEWIDEFYAANSYIDYDLLARKDIKQPSAFLKKRFPDGVQLKNCFVSPSLILQVESMVEDCIASNDFIDISTIVPTSIQPVDIETMLQSIFKRNKQISTKCMIALQTYVYSLGHIATFKKSFSDMVSLREKERLKREREAAAAKAKHEEASDKPVENIASDSQSQELEDTIKEDDREEDIVTSVPKSPDSDREVDTKKKTKFDDIELTAEDLKRERRQKKKGKQRVDDSLLDINDSDDEQSGRRSKGSSSRKSGGGGGTQGREIKQKATKKKYVANKGKQVNPETSTPTSARKEASEPEVVLSIRTTESSHKTSAVGLNMAAQVESLIEECIQSNGSVDVSTIFPESTQPEEIESLLQDTFKKNEHFSSSCMVILRTHVCSFGYIAMFQQSADAKNFSAGE